MGEKTGLPAVPSNASPELKALLNRIRQMLLSMNARLDEQEETTLTIEQLLKGTAPNSPERQFVFGPVTNIKMDELDQSVRFTFSPYKSTFAGNFLTDVAQPDLQGQRTELWRSLQDENALDAQIVNSTTGYSMDDHPPPGVTYRYWLRYASDDADQAGPFSPGDGFEYTALEVVNPEDGFDLLNGGVFLETFQGQDVETQWTETDPTNNLPTISYPPQGIVGGTVAQFAGDESWRVHNGLIPFDPTVLYRMRVGVRYTVAPTNPAKNTFFAGVTGVAADGSTLINRAGANAYSTQHYICLNGASLTPGGINNWQTFTGYFGGLGAPGPNPAPNIGTPSPLFTGIKFFRPTFIINYDDGDGTAQVDYIRIEALNPLDIALDVDLTLASVVLPADTNGAITSYSGAAGTMEVRYANTLLNGNPAVTFAVQSNPFALTAAINASGVFTVTGGFDSFEDAVSIVFRASFRGVNVDRTFALGKTRDGAGNWTPVVDIDSGGGTIVVTPTSLQKIGGVNAWDSSVYSLETFVGGAYVSFRSAQTNLAAMIGLNSDAALDANYTSIDYAWYPNDVGIAQISESGALIASFGAYTTATVFGISYDGEAIRYTKDGVLIREVKAVGRTLGFDSSFYYPNSKTVDIRFGPQPSSTDLNSFVATGTARYSDTTIEKVGGASAYDSDVYSIDSYNACTVTWQAADTTHEFFIALNTDPQIDTSYTSLDYSIQVAPGGAAAIYESGVLAASIGSYTSATVLSIDYDGQYVRYFKDGVKQREVLTLGRVFFFDSSIYTPGSRALNVHFVPSARVSISAAGLVARNSCVIAGDSIGKVGGATAFDSDVYSLQGYTEGAFCSARPAQTTMNAMFGLNTDPTLDQNYTSIDYAWYASSSATLQIFESGSLIKDFGAASYTTSTTLAIRHIGPIVQYIKDGEVVWSTVRAAVTPLFFDSSFNTPGYRFDGVQFGPAGKGAEADPSAVYLETFENRWETSFADVGNDATLVATYLNNGQFGGKVIRAQNQLYIKSNENIPFDSTSLYRITTSIRRIASGAPNEKVYCGVFTIQSDGVTTINAQWNCASNFDMSAVGINTWKTFVGYFRGLGSTFGVAENVDNPTNLDAGTTFFRPALVLNYPSGTGTMECDFIKVERLVSPDNVDNTDRQRICPDSEFDRSATLGVYWFRESPAVGVSNITPVLSTSGGAVGGKVSMSGSATLPNTSGIVSRRQPPIQSVPGQMYTAHMRWRRISATYTSGSIGAGLWRHAQDPASNSVFSSGTSDVVPALGGLTILQPEIAAATINVWQETNSLIMIPFTSTFAGGVSPWISGYVRHFNAGAGNNVEIDFLQVTAGIACPPRDYNVVGTTTFGLDAGFYFRKVNHNNTAACVYSLPAASADIVGAKIYFEQTNTGLMSIAPTGGDTLLAPPNRSGTVEMRGKNSQAYAECKSSNSWAIYGDVVITGFSDDASTSFTVGANHSETIRRMTSGSAVTITLPNSVPSGWLVGQSMGFIRGGTGTVTFTSAGTIRTPRTSAITVQNGKAAITLAGTGIWELSGDI